MIKICFFCLLLSALGVQNLTAQNTGPVAYWQFDGATGSSAIESVKHTSDSITGNFQMVAGVRGQAIKFDGFTTRITLDSHSAPEIEGAITFEAWLAPQAYPWNWSAIVERKNRYFFGLDATGHIALRVYIDKQWRECVSATQIPFMQWSHVAASFDPEQGLTVYINGKGAGRLAMAGHLEGGGGRFQIGRNLEEIPAASSRKIPASFSFDGIIDELKIYSRALSAGEISDSYQSTRPSAPPPLTWRKLPTIPDGQKHFGAYYTRLKFYPEWDRLWRIDDFPDLVVTFDEAPYKMVFWHGTTYNMNMVTENGRWIGDQSAEAPPGENGCIEHMSDKQARYSHVRLLEDTPARIVVHWRYAMTDVLYNIGETDPVTNWGDWVDEYYTIYPDGLAVRHFLIHAPRSRYSITEPATLNNPGEKAEDNVFMEALTLENMQGATHSYSWQSWPSSGKVRGTFFDAVPDANISVINTKSEYKPLYIYEPGTEIIPYGGGIGETRPWFSKFPIWNHWPVAQIPSDGRDALALDRVSSSAITSPEPPMKKRASDGAVEGRFLMGLTSQSIGKALPVAKSWLNPADLTITSGNFVSDGYSRDDRAYHLRRTATAGKLEFRLQSSDGSATVNPAFVIDGWGAGNLSLKMNGKQMAEGKNLRVGHLDTLDGTTLIVWIQGQISSPASFSFTLKR